MRVVGAIQPKIRIAEIERALRKPTTNLEAYDLVLRGRWTYEPARKESFQEAASLTAAPSRSIPSTRLHMRSLLGRCG